tara:strand:- start:2448 stop:2714 length:267 start_codon:yes stop_codon:yes gene_type:complete
MKQLYLITVRITIILGILSYLVTVGIAFIGHGFVIGVLSASLPLLSNAYWAISLWESTEAFHFYYVNSQIALLILILLSVALNKLSRK